MVQKRRREFGRKEERKLSSTFSTIRPRPPFPSPPSSSPQIPYRLVQMPPRASSSASSSNSSASKKRKTATEAADDPSPTPSTSYFFVDGNVLLQVESTLFKVHRSILEGTEVFADTLLVGSAEGEGILPSNSRITSRIGRSSCEPCTTECELPLPLQTL